VSVCGIDVGSLRTPSAVAWLSDSELRFTAYVAGADRPLPDPPDGLPPVVCFALDAPQGLPSGDEPRRSADRAANTPTRVLPRRRADVPSMPAYAAFVEAGLTIFWEASQRGLAKLDGAPANGVPTIVETYPRFVIRTLWPELSIPAKRKEPQRYVAEIWPRMEALGYAAAVPPATHHEVDAALCALAARTWARGLAVEVGASPRVDATERVLREGFIVAPASRPGDRVPP
jgi:predicted nuclease with RNAse H fold